MGKKWVPLESNPEILSDLADKLGVSADAAVFSDVFGLDEEMLAMIPQPVQAVIMCYPITDSTEAAAKQEDEQQASQGAAVDSQLLYMKQTIGNACGTIALLHCLGNTQDAFKPAAGSFLERFYAATAGMNAQAMGSFLEEPPAGAPDIEEAHKAAAASGDTAPPGEDEEVNLHFVAFVHKNGKLWQLDGRRAGPVCHGSCSADSLLQDSAAVVKEFVERSNSLSFNLIALSSTQ